MNGKSLNGRSMIDYRVWAPVPDRVRLLADGQVWPMVRDADGWWTPQGLSDDLRVSGVRYGYLLDDDPEPRPDPRSRRQPDGVHGLSETYDPTGYAWGDDLWTGRQLAGGVVYELHVGTFTPEGTLTAAIARLDHLVDLGIDFVELMPVNAFNGPRNWGYDGVLWYAVQEEYGGPEAHQRFVDACHQRGLGVIQDVVHNHLGPSGNHLPEFAPYLSSGSTNPWGESVNLDGEDSDEVRTYIIENALAWLRDHHVDGLRLDAVHALSDHRAVHLLAELAVEVDVLSTNLARPLSLIAESDRNDPRLITPREAGGHGLTAQWSDDFHHALYVSLTGDTSGYYADFASIESLAKVFTSGFFHDGTRSSFRGRKHGSPIDTLHTPTWRLVVCQDNHDQIGNRAAGTRLSEVLDGDQLKLAALLTLLSPFTPMIFMGEEWGAQTPWQYFTAHPEPELAAAVVEGRLAEFEQMDWDTSAVPDPQELSTFTDSKLDWSERDRAPHGELLEFTRELLALRRSEPDLTDPRFDQTEADFDDDTRWLVVRRGGLVLAVNFSASDTTPTLGEFGEVLLTVGEHRRGADGLVLGPHAAMVARSPISD